jgi:phospholysine phosphohistidine inorganic pyrophosphate phosphatase
VQYRALLIDLEGVIYQHETPVLGAAEALGWVRAQSIPHAFVTNTTSQPRRALVEKLAHWGVPVQEEQIITPAVVAAECLRREARLPAALFVPPPTRADFAGVTTLAEDSFLSIRSMLGPSNTYRMCAA